MSLEYGQTGMHEKCYAVKVRSRQEGAIATTLCSKGYEVMFPSYTLARQYSDRIRKVKAALFPGYIFVRMNPENMLGLVSTDGVSYVVRSGSGITPLSDAETRTVEALCRADGSQALEPFAYLQVGQRVRIEAGPMAGLEGFLTRVRNIDRVVVTVETLHSSVSIELGHARVRILDEIPAGSFGLPSEFRDTRSQSPMLQGTETV